MKPVPEPSLRTLFIEALELPDDARAAYLDRQCGVGTTLREQVEALVRAQDLPGGFLPEGPSGPATSEAPWPEEGPGSVIGPYCLREKLGEGGWGVVYVAEQRAPVRRTVALKLIKPGMDLRRVLARFEAERHALALMDHPHIATVLDAGVTVRGRPFFVMERVDGERITTFCNRHRLGIRGRLDLFLRVCNAVHHAHQKGVIHRDLKPSNILVALRDGVAIPKVIDFGIAKSPATGDDDPGTTHPWPAFLGTPAYVSPEQALGRPVDTRSDLYSLGVLLHELLAGATPFDGQALIEAGIGGLRRTIAEVEPPSLARRAQGLPEAEADVVAAARATTPSRWRASLRGDLEAIVAKCLAKDPARRYETAHALAQDLRRHLAGETVHARPGRPGYRLQKWVGRHRLAVMAGGVAACALLMALVLSTWAWRREAVARVAGDGQRARAEAGELSARRAGIVADMNLAAAALEQGQLGRVRSILRRSIPSPGLEDLRHWEWRWLDQASRGDAVATLHEGPAPVVGLAVTRDGACIVRDGGDGVRVLDMASGQTRAAWDAGPAHGPLAITPDGLAIAWGMRLPNGGSGVGVRRAPWTGPATSIPIESPALSLAMLDRGEVIASFEADATLRLYDLPSGKAMASWVVARPEGTMKGVLAASPAGDVLAWGGTDGWVHLLEPSALRTLRSWQASAEGITALAFSPEGSRIASGAGFSDTRIRLWDAATGDEVRSWEAHPSWVSALAWSPEGRRLASGGGDQTVQVWGVGSDPARQDVRPAEVRLRGHWDTVQALAWSPDGRTLASGGRDGRVLVWDPVRRSSLEEPVRAPGAVASFQFLPGTGRLVASGWDGTLFLCGLPHAGAMRADVLGRFDGRFGEVAVTADGSRVAIGTDTGWIEEWDLNERRLRARARMGAGVPVLLAHQPVRGWWAVEQSGNVRLWPGDGPMPDPLWRLPEGVVAASLAPDFGAIASVHRDGTLRLWRAVDGRVRAGPVATGVPYTDVVHAPDGRVLATTGEDGVVRLWDAAGLRARATMTGHLQEAWAAAFSPDGRRLATGGRGRDAVKLWDPGVGAEVLTLRGEGAKFYRVRFSPDGRYVGAVARGGALSLWDAGGTGSVAPD